MANSIQFFNHTRLDRVPVDWGTGEPQHMHFDPTVIKAPTFLLKNQPIEQFYRKNRLELSNLRLNDQLTPKPFKINMLEKQIQQPFPMQHPFTSHMSQSALFPSYTAPEDSKLGEAALHSSAHILDPQSPAQVEDSIVVEKTHGFPWRHEIKTLNLPTQKRGVWFPDEHYYHIPKPNESQQFYPYPPSVLVPNTKLRPEERSIDARTANVLRNKEKQLMMSSNQIDYYKDGLGTHAPLSSDNLLEKKKKYDSTGQVNDKMKPYFKRGSGLTQYSTSENKENKPILNEQVYNSAVVQQDKMLTKVEIDEIEMETGKEYKNYPESNYINNSKVKTVTAKQAPTLKRSNTMPNVKEATIHSLGVRNFKSAQPQNKLDAEKQKIDAENHQRIQAIQTENRKADIDLITPDRDVRLLRMKYAALENGRGAQPNLKQNVQPHVNTLYQQEGKYNGERAQLYRTQVYNPYLVKQYVESVKAEPTISTNFTSGSANPSMANFHMPNDTYENRPKLFAHKVFSDYELLKRNPLELLLIEPGASASLNVQENGQILQQSTYGGSYSTKKFLQEYEASPNKTSCEHLYRPLESGELEYQNITLKSAADNVALANYKNGLTNSLDLNAARDIVDANEKKQREIEKYQYPRMSGPLPPEPYERIYCNSEISEISDGNSKRMYSRVYDSPNMVPNARYEPLRADLDAMAKYEAKAIKDFNANQEHLKKLELNVVRRANGKEVSFTDKSHDKAARRMEEPIVVEQIEKAEAISTYRANYSPYTNEQTVKCPPNEFYEPVEYAATSDTETLPKNIIELKDKWSKSLANQNYLAMYQSSCPDLRKNITTGKKRIMDAPQYVYKFANH